MKIKSPGEGIATLCACFFFPCYLAVTIVFLIIPILFIIVGIINLHECKIEPRIPIWMISIAVLILLERIFETIKVSADRKYRRRNPRPESCTEKEFEDWEQMRKENESTPLLVISYILRIAVFCGTIVGSVFVFSIFKDRRQCDGLVYWSSFTYCVLSISVYVLAVVLFGCLCCLLALNITLNS